MTIGLIGKKCGMTRIFSTDGKSIPVTVIAVLPQRITQVKTLEKDGYCAIQVTYGTKKANKISKPLAGHLAHASVGAGEGLLEFRLDQKESGEFTLGKELTLETFNEIFKTGVLVDINFPQNFLGLTPMVL